MRKLGRMAEREADRAHPERLRQQAVTALVSEVSKDISTDFLHKVREFNSEPEFFSAEKLQAAARSRVEVEIAQAVAIDNNADAIDAISDALRLRTDACSREQKCHLIADRHPEASKVAAAFRKACDDAILVASVFILEGRKPPRQRKSSMLAENLLLGNNLGSAP